MINNRFTWFLESNRLIINQSGFHKKKETIHPVVHLETFIKEAFRKKEHLAGIFFDLEKDSTLKYGIMKDLHNLGLRGRLSGFPGNFLFDRNL